MNGSMQGPEDAVVLGHCDAKGTIKWCLGVSGAVLGNAQGTMWCKAHALIFILLCSHGKL